MLLLVRIGLQHFPGLLEFRSGVADLGFRLNAGHMASQVGHRDAIAKDTFELVGEPETGVREIQRVVQQVGAMAMEPSWRRSHPLCDEPPGTC